jgi:hypothetical protein
MNKLHEALDRFRQLTEASIGKAMKAADRLVSSHQFDTSPPTWLNGVGVRLDSLRNGYIEIGVLPSFSLPSFPSHYDGVPVVVKHREKVTRQVT